MTEFMEYVKILAFGEIFAMAGFGVSDPKEARETPYEFFLFCFSKFVRTGEQ